MDSKQVNKYIKSTIWVSLKEVGFSKFTSRNAWRFKKDTIDVVNFQSFNSFLAQVHHCTTYSFAVNLGVYFMKVPNQYTNNPIKIRDGNLMPEEYSCHLRKNLIKSDNQDDLKAPNIWYINSLGDNVISAIEDVQKVLLSNGLNWFEKYSHMDVALDTLLNEDEQWFNLQGIGRKGSPIRNYIAGYVASALEDYELASNLLEKVISSNCFNNIEETLRTDYERFSKIANNT